MSAIQQQEPEAANGTGQAVSPPKKSVMLAVADRYGMEPSAFEATLRATVMPGECTREQMAAFLIVVNEYQLNPMLREIYAMPTRGGGIAAIVSVDGWITLINRQPAMDGMTFEDHLDKDNLTAVTCQIWRKGRSKPTTVTEYMAECRRNTDTWRQWPRRMLRHKATIQCARYAFGFAGIMDPDEYDRMMGEPHTQPMRDITSTAKPAGLEAPPPPTAIATNRPEPAKEPANLEAPPPPKSAERQAKKPNGKPAKLAAEPATETGANPDISPGLNPGQQRLIEDLKFSAEALGEAKPSEQVREGKPSDTRLPSAKADGSEGKEVRPFNEGYYLTKLATNLKAKDRDLDEISARYDAVADRLSQAGKLVALGLFKAHGGSA